MMRETAKRCEDSITLLDKTRVGKSGSAGYERLHKLLEAGSRLGAQASVNEMTEFLKRFVKLSEDYHRSHDSLLGLWTKDGESRLTESRNLADFGKLAREELKRLSAGLGEKDTPIGVRLTERSANLEYLKTRQRELQPPTRQTGPQNPEQAAPQKRPAAVLA